MFGGGGPLSAVGGGVGHAAGGGAGRQELPEHDKRARRSQLRRYHDQIRRCRCRQVATALHALSGEVLGDLSEVGRKLASYWWHMYGVLQGKGADEVEFLSYVQEWPGPQWEWRCGETQSLAASIWDSAPPGGLPYVRRATAPSAAHTMLDQVAEHMQASRDMPDTILPIALMQSGSKFISLRANVFVAGVVVDTVTQPQQGFFTGRRSEEFVSALPFSRFPGAMDTVGGALGHTDWGDEDVGGPS